jgi:hypothetical protein
MGEYEHNHEHDDDHGPEHPKDRPMEVEDPLQLNALELDGDPEVLLTCLVEEFARMGWDADAILRTFSQEEYQGPHRLLKRLGPERARQRVEQIIARCGVWKMRTVESAPVEAPSSRAASVGGETSLPQDEIPVSLTVGGHRIGDHRIGTL